MGRMSSYKTEIRFAAHKLFFFATTTKPVLTDSLASCQIIPTNIYFPGGKDTVLLSSRFTLSGDEIMDVRFTPFPLGQGYPIRGPRQHLQIRYTVKTSQ